MKKVRALFCKKRLLVSLAVGLTAAMLCAMIPFGVKCEEIRGSVLRLHIIAASDSKRDQELKLMVRDRLLECSDTLLEDSDTLEAAIASAREGSEQLKSAAEAVLRENGCEASVSVSVGKAWFNTREYEDFTLPAGEYEALRVVIGEGQGKNWWCVMFPAVCLPAAAAEIDDALDEDGARIVHGKTVYRPAFGIVELYERIKKFLIE